MGGFGKAKKLICGIGVNDADYPVTLHSAINGKYEQLWVCPFYETWKGMIHRCYSAKKQSRRPTYIGCAVISEWHSFSIFRIWMLNQKWEGNHLDKDILFPGNKVYSPDTCIFVSQKINAFITDCGSVRGEWPAGVSWNKSARKFQAGCQNPFTGRNEYLGVFTCPEEAHEAWRHRKNELAFRHADAQEDTRIAAALRARYKKQTGEQ